MTRKRIACDRCGRRYRGQGDWNVIFTHGVATGYLCPDDQTGGEHIEAAVNEAMGAGGGARTVYPGDAGYVDAVAAHQYAVVEEVWREWLTRIVETGESAAVDPYALADEALSRIERNTGMTPKPDHRANVRETFAATFRDFASEVGGRGNGA